MRSSGHRWRGFTLAEVLLAIGLIAVALLALIGHSTLLMGAAQKSDDTSVAAAVARSHLDRLASQVALDQPSGQRQRVWAQTSSTAPFVTVNERVGSTEYQVEVFVSDIVNARTGFPLGTGPTGAENPKTRLKQIEAVVTWWDSKTQDRPGYGKLEHRAARLLKVAYEAP